MPVPPILEKLLKKFKLFGNLNVDIRIGTRNQVFVIDRSNFNTLRLSPEVQEVAGELFGKGMGFGRTDLAYIESRMSSPKERYRKIIDELKPYLRPPDHAALLSSATIIMLEDEAHDTYRLVQNFNYCYGGRGKKIYNMLRSVINHGHNIFEGIILPFLEEAKKNYKNDEVRVTGIFTIFFEELVKYYPNAIWIDQDTTRLGAIHDITERLEKYQDVPVFMYARGRSNMALAEEICKDLKNCNIEKYSYDLGWQRACRYTISEKEKSETL